MGKLFPQNFRRENMIEEKKLSKTIKVQDVVGLYLNPPDTALVLSVDEKSQIQASVTGDSHLENCLYKL